MLKSISDRRKKKLLNSSLVDSTDFVKGCLVFASNISQTNKTGVSQELAPPLKGIYRAVNVGPTHLRLAEISTGAEHTLPREFCQRITISDLARLRVNLKALQMARIAKKMVVNNRFVQPNKKITLLSLLDLQPKPLSVPLPDVLSEVTGAPSRHDESKNDNDPQEPTQQNLWPSPSRQKVRGLTNHLATPYPIWEGLFRPV